VKVKSVNGNETEEIWVIMRKGLANKVEKPSET
jgi:hypothetical protein